MTNQEIEIIRKALDTEVNHKDYVKHLTQAKTILNKQEAAISVTRCCKNVKEKYTPTFEVNLNSKQAQKDRCDQMTKILTAPSKVYYFNGTNYIEIEP
tara:strand:+ start:182 stop:475 length:294 start_codon:yes stop_codon:yes gene_type:complete